MLSRLRCLSIWREGGQSVVEIAMLMPILVVLLTGALDVGRAYFAYVNIVGAAEYGAIVAANHPDKSEADIRSTIVGSEPAASLPVQGSDITLAFPEGRASGRPASVTVRYQFNTITPFVADMFGDSGVVLQATASQAIQ